MKGSIAIAAMITAIGVSQAHAADDFAPFMNPPDSSGAVWVKICSVFNSNVFRTTSWFRGFWTVNDCKQQGLNIGKFGADIGCLSLTAASSGLNHILYSFEDTKGLEDWMFVSGNNRCGWNFAKVPGKP
jgi:hypothetical protein